jgi:hypothetical protein
MTMLVVFAAVGWCALDRDGASGLQAAAIAANVCWLSSCVALVLAGTTQNTPLAVHGVLGGMLVRMFVPGFIGLVVQTQQGPLARAGFLRYILVFFLASLVVETCLLLRMLSAGKAASAPASTKVS